MTIRALEHPTLRDIAWAAGIYEGEGTAAKNGKSSTSVSVKQKDDWILRRFQKLFGGRVCERTYVRRGYGKDKTGTNSTWVISGARARGFLMTIYTFLSPRRKAQAKRALGIF